MLTKQILVYFFLATIISFSSLATQSISVSVNKPAKAFTITGKNLEVYSSTNVLVAKSATTLSVRALKSGIQVNKIQVSTPSVKILSTNLIHLNKHQYRDSIEVILDLQSTNPLLIPVHTLPLETYLVGTVSSEVPQSWPLEALKAQAIASRTYAINQKYKRINQLYHVKSSVLDQVYKGASNENSKAKKAVKLTRGQILTFKSRPAEAYFHSTCGGFTEDASHVWGKSLPYLITQKNDYCRSSPRYNWNYNVSRKHINKSLAPYFTEPLRSLKIISKTKSGRIKTFQLVGSKSKKNISGDKFRSLLGYNNLKSTLITDISFGMFNVSFKGRGFGHGVGMCQWGAANMAKKGFSTGQILSRYYPNTSIERIY